MTDTLNTVLLLALPASGKSEVRRFLAHQTPETCASRFHMGPTVQLDDYPYVHFMRCIDEALAAAGHERVFFASADKGFKTPLDWGTLIALLNDDYRALTKLENRSTQGAAAAMLTRFDAARREVGAAVVFEALAGDVRTAVEEALDPEVKLFIDEWNAAIPETLDGKTIVIEFARGGPDGAGMPLPKSFGYQYSLGVLSGEILENAVILYVWVTPEQSRAKNRERTKPNADGSILFHGVPEHVMYNDYGVDDMEYLLGLSDRPSTIKLEQDGKTHYLPTGRCDNRADLTTFVREDTSSWPEKDVAALTDALATPLHEAWKLKSGG